MLIQGKILSYGDDLSDVFMICRKVFIDEMKLPEEDIFDEQDDMAMHVIVYEEAGSKKAVATGRIRFDGTNCEIDHIAVLKDYRSKMYGDFTVRMLLNKAFIAGVHDVKCVVFTEVIEFFEKIGFHKNNQRVLKHNQECHMMSINMRDVITSCHKKT